jgi:hypothetical protein
MSQTKPIKVTIRAIRVSDADRMNRYWREATDEDLARMGEIGRPDPEANTAFLTELCGSPQDPRVATEGIRIWCVEEEPIGYSTLKSIAFGDNAQIHLHLWAGHHRRKGYGAVLFCLSALSFIEEFRLKALYCQPKRDNPMPNGLLRKVGFAELAPVEYRQRDGSVILQSRFHIEPGLCRRYLTLAVSSQVPFIISV